MGGDWYDIVERRDGRVGIVIGDVVGHGISAIATMIHVSTILSGLVRSDVAVDEIIGQAASMLDVEGMIGTAQVLLIDHRRDELAMISAGHPPPLLRLPDGRVERLAEATHAPLGVGDGSGRVVQVPFPPGSSLLSYTDGLVERRDEPIDVGISRLADVFAATNGSVWGAVSDVLEAMAVPGGERSGDDVAVVIAHHRLPVRPADRRSGQVKAAQRSTAKSVPIAKASTSPRPEPPPADDVPVRTMSHTSHPEIHRSSGGRE